MKMTFYGLQMFECLPDKSYILGNLPVLEQGVTEFMDSLRCNLS